AKNLEGEVRRVLECRQELVAVWLPRMWEIHRGTRLSVPERGGGGETGAGLDPAGKLPAVSRKELEETVKWVLGGGGRIHVRRNGQVQLIEKVGDLPTGKVDFWTVSLNGEKFGRAPNPGELRRLGQFRSVRQLYLGAFDLAPTDWSFLAGMRQLEILHFTGVRLDSGAAAWIARCKDLQNLELMNCGGLKADFFRVLAAGVPGLKVLSLSGSQVPDAAGMELGRLERLESLCVDATGLTPAVLPSWAGIRSLRSLILSGGAWPREVLEVLRRHPIEKLGCLDPDHAGFPAQLALIGELFPKLRNLEIRGKFLSVDHAEALVNTLKNLEVLNLNWVEPSVGAAKALAKLPHLRVLTCRAAGLGDEVFQELLAIRSLQELDVLGTQVSDQSTEAICRAGLNGLRAVNVAGTRVSKGAAASVERRVKGLNVRTVPSEIGLVR
ncbi:MAG: Internalin-A precursor, partial [Verrucomicrobiota bacterium]